jgi:hypothetical protein
MILPKKQMVVEIPISGRLEGVSGARWNMRIAFRWPSLSCCSSYTTATTLLCW